MTPGILAFRMYASIAVRAEWGQSIRNILPPNDLLCLICPFLSLLFYFFNILWHPLKIYIHGELMGKYYIIKLKAFFHSFQSDILVFLDVGQYVQVLVLVCTAPI